MAIINKKICLVGDFGVGKTSLIRRFVDAQFSDQYLSTVGVKISKKQVDFPANTTAKVPGVNLVIWDLEGHTKFKAIAPSYLQGSSGAIIVADLTRDETIERLGEHIKLFQSVNAQGSMIIALNKVDLVEPEKLDALVKLAEVHSAEVLQIYVTSAKTGQDVDNMFLRIAEKIV